MDGLKNSRAATNLKVRKSAQRLDPQTRRQQILDAAISYFAEAGFTVQTRELTRRIGVSQPLLYRYFASRNALIEAVFETVFMNQWQDSWLDLLRDRRSPLRERLMRFYREYITATYKPEWLRIYMYSGLSGFEFNRDYVTRIVEDRILRAVCVELRHDYVGQAPGASYPEVGPREIELAWTLQSSAFYWVVRHEVFRTTQAVDFEQRFGDSIDLFLAGAKSVYPRLLDPPSDAGRTTSS